MKSMSLRTSAVLVLSVLLSALACYVFLVGTLYVDRYLKSAIRTFFEETIEVQADIEKNFLNHVEDQELELQNRVKKLRKQLTTRLKLPASMTVFIGQAANSKGDWWFGQKIRKNFDDYTLDSKAKHFLKIRKIYDQVVAKYETLDPGCFGVTYFDIGMSHLMISTLDFEPTMHHMDKSMVDFSFGHKPIYYPLAKAMAGQFANKYRPNFQVDYFLYSPLKQVSGVVINPDTVTFGKWRLFNSAYKFNFTGIPFHSRDISDFKPEKSREIWSRDEMYRGFLVFFVNLEGLYKRWLKSAYKDSQMSTFSLSELKEVSRDYQLYDLDELKIVGKNYIKGEELREALSASGGSLKLTFTENGERFFCHALQDNVTKNTVSFFEVSEQSLIQPAKNYLKVLGISLLVMFVFLMLAIMFMAYWISKPLTQLTRSVQSAKLNLDNTKLQHLKLSYQELDSLKAAFVQMVGRIRRQLEILNALSEFQKQTSLVGNEEELETCIIGFFESRWSWQVSLSPEGELLLPKEVSNADSDYSGFSEQIRATKARLKLTQEMQENLILETELELASNLQSSLMQSVENLGDNVASYYEAARFLGGDILYGMRNDRELVLAIGDVSGKGLAASLLGSSVFAMMDYQVKSGRSVSESLERTNNYICSLGREGFFCTAFLLRHDIKSGRISYASAGHNKMYYVKSSEVEELSCKGLPLGIFEDFEYEEKELELVEGGFFALYTDGITEAEDQLLELYSEERLKDLLLEGTQLSPNLVKQRILDDLNLFCDGAEQSDDITFLLYNPMA